MYEVVLLRHGERHGTRRTGSRLDRCRLMDKGLLRHTMPASPETEWVHL